MAVEGKVRRVCGLAPAAHRAAATICRKRCDFVTFLSPVMVTDYEPRGTNVKTQTFCKPVLYAFTRTTMSRRRRPSSRKSSSPAGNLTKMAQMHHPNVYATAG